MKQIWKLMSGVIMIGVMLVILGGISKVWAEDTLVEFHYNASGKLTGDKLEEYGMKDGYNPTAGNGILLCYMDSSSPRALEWSDPEYNNGGVNIVPIIRASLKNQWGNTPSFLIRTSTKGYTSVKFTAMLGGSSNGPAHWKLQYSLDGNNFNDIPSSDIKIPFDTRKTMSSYYNAFALPAEVSDKDNVYLRIISSSTDTIVGGNYLNLPIGGEIAINGIRITGTDINSITTPAPVTTKTPETTKGREIGTTRNNENTTAGGENNQTTKPAQNPIQGGETTKQEENEGQRNTEGNVTGSQNERSTHIVTQTNASGETVTSIVYDETSAGESSQVVTETGKESETETDTSTEKETKKTVSKKKTATSGNIEEKEQKKTSNGSKGIVIIIVLSVIFIAGIGAAVIVQKKKNDK